MFTKQAFTCCLLGAPILSSQAATLVDSFSDVPLTEYTQTRILDNGAATANVSFSAPSGALFASYAGSPNAPEQVVLLRNDFSLSIGQTLIVDVAQSTTTAQMDFGIAVSNTLTPTSIVNGGDTDTRDTFAFAAIYVRPSGNNIRSTFSNTATPVTANGVLVADETTVSKLWITRNTATEFALGYTDTSNVAFTSQTVNFTSSSSVGSAIGFYADLRAAGGTLGSLDNLMIVPEPSTALLGGLSLLGLLRRRRA